MALAEIINAGLNNPECSFFVGTWMGQFTLMRVVIWGAGIYLVSKFLDRIALEPLTLWLKKHFKRVWSQESFKWKR